MVNNYDRAKQWFFIGFGYSVNYFNAEHDPDYNDDKDLLDLFEKRWLKEGNHPKWYKEVMEERLRRK